jgi:hypothetical protein
MEASAFLVAGFLCPHQRGPNNITIMETTTVPTIQAKNGAALRFIFFIIIPAVLVWAYFSYYIPQQACSKAVSYHPATESVAPGSSIWQPGKQGESEYYSYHLTGNASGLMSEFKTRDEAVNDCVLSYK